MAIAKEKGTQSTIRMICKQAYRVPGIEELSSIEYLLSQSLEKNDQGQLLYIDGNWANWGIMAKESLLNGKSYLSLLESDSSNCDGKGSYLFNFRTNNQIILQAPHSFYDKYTGKIVEQLFLNDDYLAAFWNSSHRYNKQVIGQESADLSRAWQSYFMSFSKVMVQYFKNAFIVQIHGFSNKKRRSSRGSQADIILSQGSDDVGPAVFRLKECLLHHFSEQNIYIYPFDIKELGATKNTIAQQLRWLDFKNFIHIEITKPLRQKIVKNEQYGEYFSQCLMGLVDGD